MFSNLCTTAGEVSLIFNEHVLSEDGTVLYENTNYEL